MKRPPLPAYPDGSAVSEPPSCIDSHCVTCADEGIPMRLVLVIDPHLAVCEDGRGRRQDVMTGLVHDASVGDTLLVHAGTALLRLDHERWRGREVR